MTREDQTLDRLLAEGARRGDDPQPDDYGPEPEQVVEVFGSGARTLVLVHGGYFRPTVDRTHARPQARALAAAGWRVALAEYRRVPGQPQVATQDLALLDDWLRVQGHDVHAWVGHSAGGALALWRALHPGLPPARVIALAPVADFDAAIRDGLGNHAVRDWLGDNDPDRVDPSRLRAAEPAAAQQVRVVHGDADSVVPVRQSEGWPRTVLTGADHFDVIDPISSHWPRVLAILGDAP